MDSDRADAPPASPPSAKSPGSLRRRTILFAATQALLLLVLCAVALNTLSVLVTIEGEMEEVSGVSTLATLTVALEKAHGEQSLLLLDPHSAASPAPTSGAAAPATGSPAPATASAAPSADATIAAFEARSRDFAGAAARMIECVHDTVTRARGISPLELEEAEERGGAIEAILGAARAAQASYESKAHRFLAALHARGGTDAAQMEEMSASAELVEKELDRLLPYFAHNIEQAMADTRAFEREARRVVYVAGGLAVIGTLLGAILFARSVTRAVRHVGRGVHAIADQLDGPRFVHRPIEVTETDELGNLGKGVNALSLRLANTLAERDEAQEGMRAARDLALDAARAKSQFLAMMSHEIRTPMNGIIGMTELLLEEQLTPEQHEYASTVRSCGDHLLAVINDILDFSKIEAGKLELDLVPFDLRGLVEDAVEIVAVRACERGLELVVQIDEDVPETVRGDAGRIRQILINLLGNAVKFTGSGEVVVSVAKQRDGGIVFTVRDTGIGMSSAVQERLFQPFAQGDSSTTRRFGGTGLGLAICVRLVKLMDGTIGVESAEGIGSSLHVALPLPPCERAAGDARIPADVSGRRLLCVDDNATNRLVIERQARGWGMVVTSAPDGPRAIAAALDAARSGQPFDIVLLDMEMPGMDGVAVAAALHADPLMRGTILIMLSSLGHAPDRETAEAVGLAARLIKPTRSGLLRETMGRLLEAHPQATPVPRAPAPPRESHRRALVIEDNLVNQKVATRFLQRLGVGSDVAADGQVGLHMLELRSYDLVLMDCLMPVMDGFEATRIIREREAASHLPRALIVAMTANALSGDRERCLEAGMDDYLGKPVRLEDMQAMWWRWFPEDRPTPTTATPA